MATKMLIDATHPEETRVVVVDGNKVEEFDFETVNKRQLAGNIYLAKVTRVEPSLQAAFVDYGGNRHGFLAFSEIHPDYYQIPTADRKALLEEERAYARAMEDDEGRERTRRPRPQPRAEEAANGDAVTSREIGNMDVVDLGEDRGADALYDATAEETAVIEAAAPEAPAAEAAAAPAEEPHEETGEERSERRYRALDHAADNDEEIESIAEEDVAEEIRQPRKPRARKYKIQEVVKVRQIMLVQVVKEERGNKGAALTTYLSLAGRYCVLMPNTARGGGISRKITQVADRKKLKEIAGEIEVPEGAGLIIRTAGAKRTKAEIKRDYEYLMRLWEEIRALTLKSIAPAPIYEEGNLIKRTIRDLYTREIEEVLVEGAEGYRVAKDFMKMIMPSHAKVVQQYNEQMPLFARYQVETYLNGMFNPVVQLKSGGYIVIGITEALVAIDVNSGRATKEGSIEETALKTNTEAAEEIARQLRLRDLAGLIVIDFIDMEERRNNLAVEKRLKDKLKTDRARIQIGRISGFGLLEMSRQRLRPGMLEATTAPCPHCHGTGLIRSDDSLALSILRQLEEEGTRKRSREVLLKAPVAIVNFLMNQKREHIAQIELRYGMSVRIEADPSLISPDFSIEKFKTALRIVPEAHPVVSVDTSLMDDLVEEDEVEIEEDEPEAEDVAEVAVVAEAEPGEAPNGPKKKRRRRRRRKNGASGPAEGGTDAQGDDGTEDDGEGDESEDVAAVAEPEVVEAAPVAEEAEAPAKPARRRSRSRAKPKAAEEAAVEELTADEGGVAEAVAEEAQAPKKRAPRSRARKPAAPVEAAAEAPVVAEAPVEPVAEEPAPAPEPVAEAPAPTPAPAPEMPAPAPVAEVAEAAAPLAVPMADDTVTVAEALQPAPDPEVAEDGEPKPKKRGWWSLAR
ncbi:MAG: Rne/Rng family ribonuclease [Rhodobacteraceae bacterium]|nr:Rne/Rng family ribonuclease [Paracoccaceae bacterium]